jgi:hypothetical protein
MNDQWLGLSAFALYLFLEEINELLSIPKLFMSIPGYLISFLPNPLVSHHEEESEWRRHKQNQSARPSRQKACQHTNENEQSKKTSNADPSRVAVREGVTPIIVVGKVYA